MFRYISSITTKPIIFNPIIQSISITDAHNILSNSNVRNLYIYIDCYCDKEELDMEHILVIGSLCGNFELTQSIINKENHINSYYINCAFSYSCRNGHLNIAKLLYDTYPNTDVHFHSEYAFRYSCENGHLDVVKWLVNNFQNIDVHGYGEYAFFRSCLSNQIGIVKLLYNHFPDIDVHKHGDMCFDLCCERNYIDMCKLLCDNLPDIRSNNDNYLRVAKKYNNYNLMKYICNLSPYYVLETDGDIITGYTILDYLNIKSINT